MKNDPFVIEKIFDAPIDRVWNAITAKDEMKHWYFELQEFEPRVGFEFQFTGGPADRQYLHLCVITAVVPGRKITYSWRYDGYDGISYVTFELFPEAGKTRLRLTHAGLGDFPSDNPDFAPGNFAAGWTDIIGNSLRQYLEKNETS